jgi:hypothetical protein
MVATCWRWRSDHPRPFKALTRRTPLFFCAEITTSESQKMPVVGQWICSNCRNGWMTGEL